MVLQIGNVNMIPYIAYGGIKWQRNDIEAPQAGRTMDGKMRRGRVATKVRMEITCTPLKIENLRTVLNAIYPQYVTVTYDDPMSGLVTKTMYSNNNPASFFFINEKGEEMWTSITFPLVEE